MKTEIQHLLSIAYESFAKKQKHPPTTCKKNNPQEAGAMSKQLISFSQGNMLFVDTEIVKAIFPATCAEVCDCRQPEGKKEMFGVPQMGHYSFVLYQQSVG